MSQPFTRYRYSLPSLVCSAISIGASSFYQSRCAEHVGRRAREAATGMDIPAGWQSNIPWWTGLVAWAMALIGVVLAGYSVGLEERGLRSLALAFAIAALMMLLVIV